jgi:hypothetical protein
MADEHEPQQQPSFHWPPTAEELDTIQVVDMQGRPVRPGDTRRWRTGVAKASIAQIGVLASSLAAIGIALTSMLTTPAQPVGKTAKVETKVTAPAPLAANTVAPTAQTPTAQPSTFVPMVTLDIEKPTAADIHGSQVSTTPAPTQTIARAEPRRTLPSPRRVTTQRDPVSRFAVHTGLSVWKAMRAVGRTIKHQGDEAYFTRSAGGRRTARAVSLQAENAPSDR